MSDSPAEALIKAVIENLAAYSTLTDALGATPDGAKIFDQVPEGVRAPYVHVGPLNLAKLDQLEGASCGYGVTARLRLFAVSTDHGRQEAWKLGHLVRMRLADLTLTLDDPFRQSISFTPIQSGDVIDPQDPKAVFVDLECIIQWPAT